MNVHYQFNIMILRSMDMVQWLLNTMLDDARHIGRMRSVIAEKLLIETITQQHRLCRVIERTGETLQWMMMTTHLVNGDTDCRLLMNFLLSTVNDVQGGHDSSSSSLLTGYVTMQITLFRVLMALPTLMTQVQAHEQAGEQAGGKAGEAKGGREKVKNEQNKNSFDQHITQLLNTYGRVFVQSDGFFCAFIEAGRHWRTAIECLRFLITLVQAGVRGAHQCFIQVHQNGGTLLFLLDCF